MVITKVACVFTIVVFSSLLTGCSQKNSSPQDLTAYSSAEATFEHQYMNVESEMKTLLGDYSNGHYDASLVDTMQSQTKSMQTTANALKVPGAFDDAQSSLIKSLTDCGTALSDFAQGAKAHDNNQVVTSSTLFGQSSNEFTTYMTSYESVLATANSTTNS